MLDSVSPYALLRASMPKPAQTVVTAYDLFSAAQQAPVSPAQPPCSSTPPASASQEAPPAAQQSSVYSAPARRTHYIADIKTRHNAALRHAALRNQPLV